MYVRLLYLAAMHLNSMNFESNTRILTDVCAVYAKHFSRMSFDALDPISEIIHHSNCEFILAPRYPVVQAYLHFAGLCWPHLSPSNHLSPQFYCKVADVEHALSKMYALVCLS